MDVELRRNAAARAFAVSLLLVAAAAVASLGGNAFITARHADRPAPRDTLFELLPYVSGARYAVAAALVVGLVAFLAYTILSVPEQLPRTLSVFSVMYILRAGLMVLTPLADAQGAGAFVFPIVQHGMFPSGHVAMALLFVLLTDGARAPWLRRMFIALAVVVGAGLLLAHGHYSIDVAGGLLLAYFCEREWSRGALFNPLKRAVGDPIA